MNDTILLVEDGADDVLFMSRALRKAGVSNSLQVAVDGREAIDYLSGRGKYSDRSAHPIPRLILLDLMLPQLSGFDVLRWIRDQAAFAGLIVVVLTSSDHSSDIQKAYTLGANSFLSKPADPSQLTELIRDIANYWLKNNMVTTPSVGPSDPRIKPP